MSLTRRHFVEVASLSMLAIAAPRASMALPRGQGPGELFAPEGLAALSGMSMQTFEPALGQRFAISLAGTSLGTIRLISVTKAPPPPAPPKVRMVGRVPAPSPQTLTGFSLRFQGSGGMLPQGSYTLRNATVGTFPLFLVPAGDEVTPPTYTAVFNFLG